MPKSKDELEEVTQKTLQKGGLVVKLYFDVHSEEQTDLQAILADLINDKLLKAQGVVYCFGSIDEPISSNGMYTTSAIVTTLVDNLEHLFDVVFTFAPAALEVMKPQGNFVIRQSELQNALLSLSSISANYSEYVLKRVMKPEDFEKIKGDLKAREELGRRMMGKKE